MDVKCERCNTEYEFDDALVSGRGTTVKCTNCGHKFKIRRSDGDVSEDFWNVTTGDGRTLVFTSLRELQRAIQGYLVERNDRLSRGGLPPKPIGQIPELAPFFEQREATKHAQQPTRQAKTQDGLGPAPVGVSPPPVRPRQATRPEFLGPPASDPHISAAAKTTLIGTGPTTDEEAFPAATTASPAPATTRDDPTQVSHHVARTEPRATPAPRPAPPQTSTPPPVPGRARDAMNTVPLKRPSSPSMTPGGGGSMPPPLPDRARSLTPPPPPAARTTPPVPPPVRSQTPPPPPRVPSRPSHPSHPSSPVPSHPSSPIPDANAVPVRSQRVGQTTEPSRRAHRSLLAEIEEGRDRGQHDYDSVPQLEAAPRRRSVGGFIVAAVVLVGVAVLGVMWAQKNLGVTLGAKPVPSAAPAVDPRVATFLASGEKALADGNLELAKESFDKASALSEKDAHVLLGLARLAAVRADEPWLKSRLLLPGATDDQRIAITSVAELAANARRAADDALAVAPEDPAALRAKIDTLRISGDRDGARGMVPKIAASATQPETAYVLAALDLVDAEPLWSTVIERLKVASSAETGPGRARAALVYALARSGDAAGAKAEVDRLSGMAKPHPLLPLLRAFAERSSSKSPTLDAGADTGKTVDAGKAAAAEGQPRPDGQPKPTGDARSLVTQGEKARAKGDYDRARSLFNAAVEQNPNDSEALNGLAAIAYAQHDLNGARASYKRVLSINPNYMPALVGLADVEWDAGDKGAATKMYKDIVDRYPESAYPGRAKTRSEGGGG